MSKEYWITDSRFKWTSLLILIIFFTLMGFLFIEAEAIKKNPCQICSEKMGEKVTCSIGTQYISKNIYYPNGSIEEIRPNIPRKNVTIPQFNLTVVEVD